MKTHEFDDQLRRLATLPDCSEQELQELLNLDLKADRGRLSSRPTAARYPQGQSRPFILKGLSARTHAHLMHPVAPEVARRNTARRNMTFRRRAWLARVRACVRALHCVPACEAWRGDACVRGGVRAWRAWRGVRGVACVVCSRVDLFKEERTKAAMLRTPGR